MIPFDITVTHSCGHQEQHTGATATGDVQSMVDFHSKRKCSACRPTCAYCHRVGDRENMLVTDTAVFCNDWCHQQSLKPSHYREHNDIQIPGFLRHWMDSSWHNDTCGSSMYTLREGSSGQPQVDIRVWVERADPADRDDPACDRFTIEVLDDGDNEHGLLWAGDDAAVAELWAHAAAIVVCGPDDDDPLPCAEMADAIRKMIADIDAAHKTLENN